MFWYCGVLSDFLPFKMTTSIFYIFSSSFTTGTLFILINTGNIIFRFSFVSKKSLKIQRGNQNPYITGEQTTQWPKEKVQKDKQWSTKHTYKTKDRVTRTPLI